MITEVGKQMITFSLVVTSTFHFKGMHVHWMIYKLGQVEKERQWMKTELNGKDDIPK